MDGEGYLLLGGGNGLIIFQCLCIGHEHHRTEALASLCLHHQVSILPGKAAILCTSSGQTTFSQSVSVGNLSCTGKGYLRCICFIDSEGFHYCSQIVSCTGNYNLIDSYILHFRYRLTASHIAYGIIPSLRQSCTADFHTDYRLMNLVLIVGSTIGSKDYRSCLDTLLHYQLITASSYHIVPQKGTETVCKIVKINRSFSKDTSFSPSCALNLYGIGAVCIGQLTGNINLR